MLHTHLFSRISVQCYELGIIISPVLQIRRLKHEKLSNILVTVGTRIQIQVFSFQSLCYECNISGILGKVKAAQSCPTLCNAMDYTIHGVFQVRILEWVTFPFSRGSAQPRDQTQVSCIAGGFFTS